MLNPGGSVYREAVAAVDRPIAARFKRHRCRDPALRADGLEELARTALAVRRIAATIALALARVATIAAALRLIAKASLGVKLLIPRGEREAGSTVFAKDRFILVHVVTPPRVYFMAVTKKRSLGGAARTLQECSCEMTSIFLPYFVHLKKMLVQYPYDAICTKTIFI